ncbi:uncharacterized protein LOC128712508 [Anopheles marshallii]|uniref:uncharacterized protein LOC128712508 n=1 Tax=Anopheles marshallii TaxID=1521116 RepID=UPI00237B3963|nr:uncharacterized protein LOC128712508 [Anopheles marshallii]
MLPRIVTVHVVTIVLLCCSHQSFSLKLTLESFEQTLGADVMRLDLRVRKYNRTCSVINGTIHILQDHTNDYRFSLDIFYSRLGNQQFNHMPIKLPNLGTCDLIEHMYANYRPQMALIVNGPVKGECPMAIREMYIYDTEFPTEVIPKTLIRNGLWKALVGCYLDEKEIMRYNLVLKASDDL